MRRIVSLSAALILLAPCTAEAGPVRDFINKHRPGILIPKRSPAPAYQFAAPPCVCGNSCGCPSGTCPQRCPVAEAAKPPAQQPRVIRYEQRCVNGHCTLVPIIEK